MFVTHNGYTAETPGSLVVLSRHSLTMLVEDYGLDISDLPDSMEKPLDRAVRKKRREMGINDYSLVMAIAAVVEPTVTDAQLELAMQQLYGNFMHLTEEQRRMGVFQ